MQHPQVSIEKFRMHIGGEEADAVSGQTFGSENPFTGEVWAEVPDGDRADVDRAVAAARNALAGPWGRMIGRERATVLYKFADNLEKAGKDWAASNLATMENCCARGWLNFG